MRHELTFFTDPHIGLNRVSHTTPASRQKLRQAVAAQAMDITHTTRQAICLGDLFDSFTVDNAALLQGYDIMRRSHLTLYGNHDISNRADLISSIEVSDMFVDRPLVRPAPDEPKAAFYPGAGVPIWFIDHKLTQTIFEGALDDAAARAHKGSILLLHCNYSSAFAEQETTLNLVRENAQRLLTVFSHIFIGHEHNSRLDLDGRVVVLGNTHPTSFSDIGNKFYWNVDVTDGAVTKIESHLCWSVEKGYLKVDWTDLHEVTKIDPAVQFVEVTGVAPAEHMPLISRQVTNLWGLSDNLLMVRNNVTADSVVSAKVDDKQPQTRCESIPDRVTRELAGTKLEDVWSSYRARL